MRRGSRLIVAGSLVSAGFALVAKTRLLAEEAAHFFHVGAGATGISGGLSFALIGAGHLVGISVGMAMLARPGDRLVDPAADPDRAALPGRPRRSASTVFRAATCASSAPA